MTYLKTLFGILDEKLLMNVPTEEKVDFDIKKWIWSGDNMDENSIKKTSNVGAQTPTDWMHKQKSKYGLASLAKKGITAHKFV